MISVRPRQVLPTDWFIAALNSVGLPTYEQVKPYFDKMIVDGVWQKAGPSRWIVVSSPVRIVEDDRQWLKRFASNGGFSVSALARLLTVRTEWSRK